MQKCLLLCLSLCFYLPSFAQILSVKDSAVQISDLKIHVNANAYQATTTVEMEVANPNSKVLDGEINFSLAGGQVINEFRLDINGKMREGVVIEKQQARIAYENVIRRKVDPGLLEMTAPNRYRIRVYPVPAKGSRLVSFTVQQLLFPNGRQLDYAFPLKFFTTVKKTSAAIFVSGDAAPFVWSGLLTGKSFVHQANQYRCDYTAQGISTNASLSFSIPFGQTITLCKSGDDCGSSFLARIIPDSLRLPPKSLQATTVFWDVSASAAGRNPSAELRFLEKYLKLRQPQKVQLVTFAVEVEETKTVFNPASNFNAVRKFLEAQRPDGGTRLNRLRCADYPAEEYLLFSDGQNTFGEGGLLTNGKPVFCLQSAASADTRLLKQLASSTAGKVIDLVALNAEQALENLQQAQWVLGCSEEEKKRFDLTWMQTGNAFFISGKGAKETDTLTLVFRYGGREQKLLLPLGQTIYMEAQLSVAAALIKGESLAQTASGKDTLQALAMAHHLVTATASLIVLDAVDDYYQYRINPPAELLDEYKKRYSLPPVRQEEKKRQAEILVYEKLRSAVDEYNGKLRWWAPKGTVLAVRSPEEKRKAAVIAGNTTVPEQALTPALNSAAAFKQSGALSEVVVVGYGTQRRANMTGAVSTVTGNALPASTTVQSALAGRVAGVTIISGQPGASGSIQLRGVTSIRGGAEPLYVIDGVQSDAASAQNMSTFDIESISVLKDASATALYGSGAANGVIVIATKRGRFTPLLSKVAGEEEDFNDSLAELEKPMRYEAYLRMKEHQNSVPAFYFEVADYFFQQKQPKEALRIISNLAELKAEDHQVLRSVAYLLEEWGNYTEAVDVYKAVLRMKEEEPQSYRDLALAYALSGNRKEAVRLLYEVLTKDWGIYESRYQGLREIIMTELNTLMAEQKPEDFGVNAEVLQAAPVDLRVVVDWNKDETDIDLHVLEPGGEECSYNHRLTQSGGRISEDFTQGYGPEEYEIKTAVKGRYKINIDYYGDRYQKQQVPSFVKVTVFKNFGKANQTIFIKTVKLEGSEGMIELAEIKF